MNAIHTLPNYNFISAGPLYTSASLVAISSVVCKIQTVAQDLLSQKFSEKKPSQRERLYVNLTSYFTALCSGVITGVFLGIDKLTSLQVGIFTLSVVLITNGTLPKIFNLKKESRASRGSNKPSDKPISPKIKPQAKPKRKKSLESKGPRAEKSSTQSTTDLGSTIKDFDTALVELQEAKDKGIELQLTLQEKTEEWKLANETVKRLEECIETLKSENESLIDKVNSLDSENQKLEKENTSLEQEVSELQKKLNDTVTRMGSERRASALSYINKINLKNEKLKELEKELEKRVEDTKSNPYTSSHETCLLLLNLIRKVGTSASAFA